MTAQDDDLPPEAADSQHLATAFRVHAEPQLLKQYRQKTQQLEREGRWQYVGNVRNSEGYVLSEFDDHGQELLREQREIIARIEEGLMTKLQCGALAAWAREGSLLAPWRTIPPSAWRTLKLGDVIKGTATGPGVALFDIRVGVPVAPRTPEPIPVPPLPETGAPGRPSHMHLVLSEFERRVQAGQLETSLAREAATLAAWFKANHPGKQPLTAKAIENRIRKDYKQALSKIR